MGDASVQEIKVKSPLTGADYVVAFTAYSGSSDREAVVVAKAIPDEEASRIDHFDATVPIAEVLEAYAGHQTWRCEHPDRFWEDGHCPCGLTRLLDQYGVEWVKPKTAEPPRRSV